MLHTDIPSIKQRPAWFSEPRPSHVAHFYLLDAELIASLLEYVGTGLAQGDTCIIVAKPHTLINLNKELRAAGVNLAAVLHTGQYVTYDAEELLAKFMRNGLPDLDDFLRAVGGVVSLATERGRPVRAFGEMVTVLLEQRNIAGLVSLERHWDDLIKAHAFSLYCAYPEEAFNSSPRDKAALRTICACHAETVGSFGCAI